MAEGEETSEAINMMGLCKIVANTKERKITEDCEITSKKRPAPGGRWGGRAGRQNKLKESNK